MHQGLTLISHFYNEEYLLPWWLKHHRMIFNHGILINYGSTDESVSIIKKICPLWEIKDSRNKMFGALDVDTEVMEIERTITGFKTVLNTTEFLVNTHQLQQILSNNNQSCYQLPRIIMVDDKPDEVPDPNESLLVQKRTAGGRFASRFIHNYPDGQYHPGRHTTNLPVNSELTDTPVLWYGYAPYTEEFIQRKLQIANKIPDSDKSAQLGFQHLWTREQMEQRRQELLTNTYQVNLNPLD